MSLVYVIISNSPAPQSKSAALVSQLKEQLESTKEQLQVCKSFTN